MDRFEISILRDFYGSLLTEKQNEMLKLRYDDDLSFGEIAEICSVSRQAVLDSINKGERHLAEYEKNLGCLKNQRKALTIIGEIEDTAGLDGATLTKLAELRKILED